MVRSIGLVGARGHVGAELVRLIAAHPSFELKFVSSRELDGRSVRVEGVETPSDLRYRAMGAEEVAAAGADAVILALPNALAPPFVAAIDRVCPETVIVDLGADYRFADDWYYGLPELTRAEYSGQRRISNPGCYATAMQLLLAPLRDRLDSAPVCFGVSGYSGAGTTPSPRNDPDALRDNLMPYASIDHLHEREVSHHLGLTVEFLPHVAPHFRGLTITANLHLRPSVSAAELRSIYEQRYAHEPLISIVEGAPWVSRIAGRHEVEIGGFEVSANGTRAAVVATLDNLLKGAATQALQNLNIAFGFPELTGIQA